MTETLERASSAIERARAELFVAEAQCDENETKISAAEKRRDAKRTARVEASRAKAAGDTIRRDVPTLADIDEDDLEIEWRTDQRAVLQAAVNERKRQVTVLERRQKVALFETAADREREYRSSQLIPAWDALGAHLRHQMAAYYLAHFVIQDPSKSNLPPTYRRGAMFGPFGDIVEQMRGLNWTEVPFSARPSWLPAHPGSRSGYEPIPGTLALIEQMRSELEE